MKEDNGLAPIVVEFKYDSIDNTYTVTWGEIKYVLPPDLANDLTEWSLDKYRKGIFPPDVSEWLNQLDDKDKSRIEIR